MAQYRLQLIVKPHFGGGTPSDISEDISGAASTTNGFE
jgi:hypothetical protein